VLLTLSAVLGVSDVLRFRTERVPRFVIDAVHRNASLLAVAVLLVHIVTSVIDKFAPIGLIDSVVPFVSAYRPVWLGLGAVAFDLMVAVLLTSLVRRRLGHRAWRAIHWLAYLCWPVALLHSLGTGSDTKTTWMLALSAACLLAVLLAVWSRIRSGWPEHRALRRSAVLASTAGPLALVVWLPGGPLGARWASRAGTPASLLRATGASGGKTSTAGGAAAANASISFSASATGSVGETELSNGLVRVQLRLALSGEPLTALTIRIDGQPVDGGGVQMLGSVVDLGTASDPTLYAGRVTGLRGSNVHARVRGPRGQADLQARLQIDSGGATATGTVSSAPAGR
jgi:hypothetical protein